MNLFIIANSTYNWVIKTKLMLHFWYCSSLRHLVKGFIYIWVPPDRLVRYISVHNDLVSSRWSCWIHSCDVLILSRVHAQDLIKFTFRLFNLWLQELLAMLVYEGEKVRLPITATKLLNTLYYIVWHRK